jgi:hypothetical protein
MNSLKKAKAMRLLNLQEAAETLGYTVKGLRRIVERSRAKARGVRTRGPTIKFFQAGEHSPIKFRREWIEEFIVGHTVDPGNGKEHKSAVENFGLDPQFFV